MLAWLLTLFSIGYAPFERTAPADFAEYQKQLKEKKAAAEAAKKAGK